MGKIHGERTARTGADVGSERLTIFIQLSFADHNDAAAKALIDGRYLVEQLFGGQRIFGEVDEMRRVILLVSREGGGGGEPADVAAQHLDEFDLVGECAIVGIDIADSMGKETRGGGVAGRVVRRCNAGRWYSRPGA